jgi:hypothetical protein
MGYESESDVYAWCRQSRAKEDNKCVYMGGIWSGIEWFFTLRERDTLYY